MAKNDEVMDLSALDENSAQTTSALDNLKRNMAHMLISSLDTTGPELDFGADEEGNERVLYFKPKVPATAMVELIGNTNRLDGLKEYIRLALKPESRELFKELLDDIPLEGLNTIVEIISEASTSFPTK